MANFNLRVLDVKNGAECSSFAVSALLSSRFYIIVILFLFPILYAAKAFGASRDIVLCEQKAKKYGFSIENADGVDENMIIESCERVFFVFDNLPLGFVKACKLKTLIFKKELISIDGSHFGGFGGSGRMTLKLNPSAKTIVHELYHLFDKRGYNDKVWEKCNDKKFIYIQHRCSTNIGYTDKERQRYEKKMRRGKVDKELEVNRRLGNKAVKQIEENNDNETIQKGFVTKYAQMTQKEDRAETFSYMIMERMQFLSRTNNNIILQRKMKFIMKETSRCLGREFWEVEFRKPPRDWTTFKTALSESSTIASPNLLHLLRPLRSLREKIKVNNCDQDHSR